VLPFSTDTWDGVLTDSSWSSSSLSPRWAAAVNTTTATETTVIAINVPTSHFADLLMVTSFLAAAATASAVKAVEYLLAKAAVVQHFPNRLTLVVR
jgi:hypothetical protein